MLNKFAAIAFGAVIALSPLAALAETDQQVAQAAPAAGASPSATPPGTHRSKMRHMSNTSKERARASAHHMQQMRQKKPATTAPAAAPQT
jgi:hypothetical protein